MLEKQFGNHFFKKKFKKRFFRPPTLIFLGMSLETHIFFGLSFNNRTLSEDKDARRVATISQ